MSSRPAVIEAAPDVAPRARRAALHPLIPMFAEDIGALNGLVVGEACDGSSCGTEQVPFSIPTPLAPPRPVAVSTTQCSGRKAGLLAAQFFPSMHNMSSSNGTDNQGSTVDLRPLSDVGDAKMVLDELKSVLLEYYRSIYVDDASNSIASRLESLQDPQRGRWLSSEDISGSVPALGSVIRSASRYYEPLTHGEWPGGGHRVSITSYDDSTRSTQVSHEPKDLLPAEAADAQQRYPERQRRQPVGDASAYSDTVSPFVPHRRRDSSTNSKNFQDNSAHLVDSVLTEIRNKSQSMDEQLEKVSSRLFSLTDNPNSRYFAYKLAPRICRRPQFGSNRDMENAIFQLYVDLSDQVAFNERRIRAMRQRILVLQLAARNQSACSDPRDAS